MSKQTSKIPVGSKPYIGMLIFMWIMCIFVLTMIIAIAPNKPGLAMGFFISQSLWFIIAIVMLIQQIQYMRKNHIKFQPLKKLISFWRWFISFLTPSRSRFRVAKEGTSPIEKYLTAFKNEYIHFYEGNVLNKNSTQLYRHLLLLHKNRLHKMGLSLKTTWNRMELEQQPTVRGTQIKDGKYRHINAMEYIKGKQEICQNENINGKAIFIRNIQGCAEYDMIGIQNNGAEQANLRFICSGCGGLSTAQQLLEGCPFCGAKFLIEELRDRICHLTFYQSPELEQRLSKAKIDGIVNNFTFFYSLIELIIGYGSIFYEVFLINDAHLTELPIAIVLIILPTVLFFVLCLGFNNLLALPFRILAHSIYKKMLEARLEEFAVERRNQAMLSRINQLDKDFSLNYFFSNIRNKLASIHFAEHSNQVNVFATEELEQTLQSFIKSYQNVVECVFGSMELTSFEKKGLCWHAQVRTTLTLLYWNGKKIQKEKEKIEMTLIKSIYPSKKNPFGIHKPICPNCDGSVDLLKGNQCPYCGNKLNFTNVDWCIQSYEKII